MSAPRRATGVALLLALASCGGDADDTGTPGDAGAGPGADAPAAGTAPSSPAASDASAPDRALASLTCEGLPSQILPREPTRRTLRDAFGEPEATSVTTEPNRHAPERTDSLFVLSWPGAEFRLRKASGDDLPERAEITRAGVMDPDLIGVDTARVVEVLGPPTERADGEMVYDCGTGASEPVTLFVEDGVVARVRVSYYVD